MEESRSFQKIQDAQNIFVWDIIEDKNGNIRFVTSGNGAFKYNPAIKELKNYTYDENDIQSISIANNKTDEEFISRMKIIIIENIGKESFSVDDLAKHMCMSRSGLFAKIKGISEMSPLDYIRIERLKRAVELLTEGKYALADVALMVGYSAPSYFSQAFRKQFGVLPKDFRKI